MYGKCYGASERGCIRFSLGEVKKDNKGDEYFRVKGRDLDFNGKRFSKAVTIASI